MLLTDINRTHILHQQTNPPECSCGERYSDYGSAWQFHNEHLFKLQKDWLRDNDFGDAYGLLKFGTSCLQCGAVIGLPDKHREVCHLRSTP